MLIQDTVANQSAESKAMIPTSEIPDYLIYCPMSFANEYIQKRSTA